MAISVVNQGSNALTIHLGGRFDFNCHPEFRAATASVAMGMEVTVDMQGTSYVDSAALGMLLLLGEKTGKNKLVRLLNASGQPREVLKLANFHQLFTMA